MCARRGLRPLGGCGHRAGEGLVGADAGTAVGPGPDRPALVRRRHGPDPLTTEEQVDMGGRVPADLHPGPVVSVRGTSRSRGFPDLQRLQRSQRLTAAPNAARSGRGSGRGWGELGHHPYRDR